MKAKVFLAVLAVMAVLFGFVSCDTGDGNGNGDNPEWLEGYGDERDKAALLGKWEAERMIPDLQDGFSGSDFTKPTIPFDENPYNLDKVTLEFNGKDAAERTWSNGNVDPFVRLILDYYCKDGQIYYEYSYNGGISSVSSVVPYAIIGGKLMIYRYVYRKVS